MCSRNGRAIGSWPYNAIRDFSCRDGSFSFTSGRRGPFGIGTYRFQLTPTVLTKLTSAVTLITGAQFGTKTSPQQSPKQEESKSLGTSSPTFTQQGCPSPPDHYSTPPAHGIISNGSYGSHFSPQAYTDGTYDRLAKPLHSSYSSSELRLSCTEQSSCPQLVNKQISSPGPVRQIKRARHHYEEIDLPSSAEGAANTLPCVSTSSSGTNPCASLSTATDPVHGILLNSTGSVVYENVCLMKSRGAVVAQRAPARHQQRQQGGIDLMQHPPQLHSGDHCRPTSECTCDPDATTLQEQIGESNAEEMYDKPRESLYSVPVCSSGEVLTLNARRGCSQIPPLALPLDSTAHTLSSYLSDEVQDGSSLYEEIDSAVVCPRLQHSSLDKPHSVCRPAYDVDTSSIAQQLAMEEGYELVTTKRHVGISNVKCKHVMSGCCSLLDMRQGLYVNHQLHNAMTSKDAEATEENDGDGYVVVRSPNTPPGSADDRKDRVLPVKSVYQVPGLCGSPKCMYVNIVNMPVSECAAF